MEQQTHIDIMALGCYHFGIHDDRRLLLLEHTMDPDNEPDFMEKTMNNLFEQFNETRQGAQNMGTEQICQIHSHYYTPQYCLYYAITAFKLFNAGRDREGLVLLSWAVHFLVDNGTPIHPDNLTAALDYIFGRHEEYEQHVDGRIQLYHQAIREGIRQGRDDTVRITLRRLQNYARASARQYDRIYTHFDRKNWERLDQITSVVMYNIGYWLARLLEQAYLSERAVRIRQYERESKRIR